MTVEKTAYISSFKFAGTQAERGFSKAMLAEAGSGYLPSEKGLDFCWMPWT
jgi:hypothetical protein